VRLDYSERVKEGKKNGSGSYIRMGEEIGKVCFSHGGCSINMGEAVKGEVHSEFEGVGVVTVEMLTEMDEIVTKNVEVFRV
jgi:hypothetical protein